MYRRVQAFVASAADAFGLRGPLYRFGRSFPGDAGEKTWLPNCLRKPGYVGLELCGGNAFDALPFDDASAQTVLWTGEVEFSVTPQRIAEETARIIAPGGVLLMATPVKPSLQKNVKAYWQRTPVSIERLLAGMDMTMVGWQGAETCPHTIYGIGFKRPVPPGTLRGADRFLKDFQARLNRLAKQTGRVRQWMTVVQGCLCGREFRRQQRDRYRIQFSMHFSVNRSAKTVFPQDFWQDKMIGNRPGLID